MQSSGSLQIDGEMVIRSIRPLGGDGGLGDGDGDGDGGLGDGDEAQVPEHENRFCKQSHDITPLFS